MMFNKYFMLILCALNSQPGQRCRLNTRNNFFEPLPIIIRNGRLLEPNDRYGNIVFENGETITLSCSGSGNLYHPNALNQTTTATISCDRDDLFKNDHWLNGPSQFSQFKCFESPNYRSLRTNRSCHFGNIIYEVGYTVENEFYPVYESCFNEGLFTVLYSKYTQKDYNANFQTRVDRPFFIANDVYGYIPVDKLFSPPSQKRAVAQLVGPRMLDNYITQTHYLSRGHLAAKTDFPLAFGERATFHYVNCAPQWYGFNSGNWNTLEVELRNHINNAGYDTIVYTGTYGVSYLYDDSGIKVDLHLYTDSNNNPVIPIPMYYYKVVYDPNLRLGTAFVGINNPHYTQNESRELFFCRDLCRGNRDFSWLIWEPDNPTLGLSFCCSVSEFRNTVNHLPYFEVNGLLT